MKSNPRGDNSHPAATSSKQAEWTGVLAHRRKDSPATVAAVIERFEAAGVTPGEVASHLEDGGDRLYAAAASGADNWASAFGGEQAAALLAAEVSALMSHLVARAAGVRSVCVEALLDEFSAVTVGGALGVARQKVYELARASVDPDYLKTTPWRRS
ncbi:hypothetical protein [Propionimicrobium sp. PCR01-08-3]|uniref:hypothetical protein n=1 Tax=Propionimicrobium sp. PCR01-08-3 TaxID=3052086 RepID=UPI00255CD88D|nr:hypothetical protein [Propionimicrobium sp. PCR01-08-3]WIY81433.1 hypothetical protein QQ658_07700 [Propionimicrobium sp. PCR01-08-3]